MAPPLQLADSFALGAEDAERAIRRFGVDVDGFFEPTGTPTLTLFYQQPGTAQDAAEPQLYVANLEVGGLYELARQLRDRL